MGTKIPGLNLLAKGRHFALVVAQDMLCIHVVSADHHSDQLEYDVPRQEVPYIHSLEYLVVVASVLFTSKFYVL